MVNLWTIGASGSAFWGLLAGMIFFKSLLGVAAGAGAGSLAGALSDYGINDTFMKEVAGVLQPGQAALFMMTNAHATDRVIERLGKKAVMSCEPTWNARPRHCFEKPLTWRKPMRPKSIRTPHPMK